MSEITGYRFAVDCPLCGHELEHVTSGAPGTRTAAIARCVSCRCDWLLALSIAAVSSQPTRATGLPPGGGRPPARCGTDPGYRRHLREGTDVCGPCRLAHNKEVAKYKRSARTLA